MSKQSVEDFYYRYHSQAINYPQVYPESLPALKHKAQVPASVIALNTVNAYIISGEFTLARIELNAIASQIKKTGGPALRSHWHLLNHTIMYQTATDQPTMQNELDKAASYQSLSGSHALESEVLMHRCVPNMQFWEITQSEETLQKAMNATIKSDRQELILDVYLGYIQLYLTKNLVEQANREMMLIHDIILPDQNPLRYVQLTNFRGIICNMTRSWKEAEGHFRTGIGLAEKHGYIYQLAQLWMNLGISLASQRDFNGSIEMYDKSLGLLSNDKGVNLPLRAKIVTNKARALSMGERLTESVELMQEALAEARRAGRERDGNILRINLADTLIELGRFDGVPEMIDAANAYFEENKLWDMAQSAHLCKARYYEARQDYRSAFESMEQLYQVSRKYFQENFSSQSRRYQQRIEDLRNEYLLLKNQCSNLVRLGIEERNLSLIGDNPLIKVAIANAIQAAKYPFVNVHIYGESGTGKEIIARLIHESGQSSKTMIAINASTISPNLIESELFGHVKGAFTGAISDHKGKFMLANEGTLFLDEISDMPLDCQAKLLRAIEHHSIIPVGSDKELSVKCRIVSASNRKLTDLVKANLFRLDLYHRLNKVEIFLPPLRQRLSDLPALTTHFVKRFAREFGHGVPTISEAFFTRLQKHSFPGNVRELMNIIERIFILKPKPHWYAEQLDGLIDESSNSSPKPGNISQSLSQKERQLIIDTLEKVNWKQKEAAKLLEMTESTLSRHIKKLGVKK
jgi:transcriptional regulator with PAS, ATPase and Fis domain